jgi:hypothetical protein
MELGSKPRLIAMSVAESVCHLHSSFAALFKMCKRPCPGARAQVAARMLDVNDR